MKYKEIDFSVITILPSMDIREYIILQVKKILYRCMGLPIYLVAVDLRRPIKANIVLTNYCCINSAELVEFVYVKGIFMYE